MSNPDNAHNLPAQIAEAVSSVPKALVPTSIKALDRLIGAAVDIPVAWLAQQKAKIEAQTQAYTLVEASIAKAAASEAGADHATVERAVDVLVRKAYRKQVNREAVAAAMVEDLSSAQPEGSNASSSQGHPSVDEDWLNVFERYAEDASTERMQKLWGRVLAGEVRVPGRYSMRTLRFLSEFSQADALTFSEFGNSAFGDAAPANLIMPDENADIRNLIYLESAGLIQGATGLGLTRTIKFDANGNGFLREDSLIVLFKGMPNGNFAQKVYPLTPLGQELLTLLPGRDSRACARSVAHAMRTPQVESAYLSMLQLSGELLPMEVLWQQEQATGQMSG